METTDDPIGEPVPIEEPTEEPTEEEPAEEEPTGYDDEGRACGPITVHLEKPVTWPVGSRKEVSSLTLNGLRGIHAYDIPGFLNAAGLMKLAGALSQKPPGLFDQLRAKDLGVVIARVRELLWPIEEIPQELDQVDRRVIADEPVEIVLRDGNLKTGRDELSSLTLQPMTGRSFKKLQTDTIGPSVMLETAAGLAGVAKKDLNQLGPHDLAEVLGVVQGFLLVFQAAT